MKWNKLLEKQVKKYLSDDIFSAPGLASFLQVVNDSYSAYERDHELSERAFKVSEEEFLQVTRQLKEELTLKKLSATELKEAIVDMGGEGFDKDSDNLLSISGWLKVQMNKLKAGEELWQFALEGAGDGVWEYNFQTKDVFFSRQYKKMLGFTDEDFVNHRSEWRDRIHPDDLPIITAGEGDYLTQKSDTHQREYRIRHKNGQYIWVLDRGMVVTRSENGQPERIVGTHTDITERKLTEQALRLKEEKYRNIIANMNLGILEVDNAGIIRYANQSFCTLSGYTQEELLDSRAGDLFSTGDTTAILEGKDALRQKGISDAYQLAIHNKAGELKWWLISGAPSYNDAGELIGSIGIHLDITEQKNLEMELQEAREAAEQSARAKESFLTNMSHEIRTPMNAILGMSKQLEKTTLNTQQQLYLNTINTATGHLMVVINDILDISKIEAGKLDLEKIGFNCKDVLKHCLQIMQLRADEKGLELALSIGPGIADVLMGDPHRLNQVILNLASNAVKYTEKGGVSLSCKLLGTEGNRQIISIRVKDTGIGMDPVFLNNLFEKFSQEDRTMARKYGGTGLGMAISKQLVELMGGTIGVTSEKEKGTLVSITLPCEIGTTADLPEIKKTIPNTEFLKGRKILLVEDNEMNRLVVCAMLGEYGVLITEVSNGKEAISELTKNAYDLVLMDVQMPVMNGLEATTLIRKKLKLEVPVIALTANAIKGERERCMAIGMNNFVSKPFEEEELLNAMASVLPHSAKLVTKIPAEPVPAIQPALYSLEKLHQISRGGDGLVKRMVGLFIEQIPPSVVEMRTAYAAGNLKLVSGIAHRIKPVIGTLEITALKAVVKELEYLANIDPDSPKIEPMIAEVEQAIASVTASLLALTFED